MKVQRTSPLTGITRVKDLDINAGQIGNYKRGRLLQDAFPKLSADDREFFKTGITPDEWEELSDCEDALYA